MGNVSVNVLIPEPLAVVARMVGVSAGVSLNDFFARAIAGGCVAALDEIRQGDRRPDRHSIADVELAASAAGLWDAASVKNARKSGRRPVRRAARRRDELGELDFDG